jgi:hypothetical protein
LADSFSAMGVWLKGPLVPVRTLWPLMSAWLIAALGTLWVTLDLFDF